MAIKRILLDTNAYVAILKNEQIICNYVSQNQIIGFSCFVITELQYGFRAGTKEQSNLDLLNKFISEGKYPIFHTSQETINNFVAIKHHLKQIGKPIPAHDIWIAAQAKEYQCQLITYDKHFKNIGDLDIWPDFN